MIILRASESGQLPLGTGLPRMGYSGEGSALARAGQEGVSLGSLMIQTGQMQARLDAHQQLLHAQAIANQADSTFSMDVSNEFHQGFAAVSTGTRTPQEEARRVREFAERHAQELADGFKDNPAAQEMFATKWQHTLAQQFNTFLPHANTAFLAFNRNETIKNIQNIERNTAAMVFRGEDTVIPDSQIQNLVTGQQQLGAMSPAEAQAVLDHYQDLKTLEAGKRRIHANPLAYFTDRQTITAGVPAHIVSEWDKYGKQDLTHSREASETQRTDEIRAQTERSDATHNDAVAMVAKLNFNDPNEVTRFDTWLGEHRDALGTHFSETMKLFQASRHAATTLHDDPTITIDLTRQTFTNPVAARELIHQAASNRQLTPETYRTLLGNTVTRENELKAPGEKARVDALDQYTKFGVDLMTQNSIFNFDGGAVRAQANYTEQLSRWVQTNPQATPDAIRQQSAIIFKNIELESNGKFRDAVRSVLQTHGIPQDVSYDQLVRLFNERKMSKRDRQWLSTWWLTEHGEPKLPVKTAPPSESGEGWLGNLFGGK